MRLKLVLLLSSVAALGLLIVVPYRNSL
ncbi:MAG: hypothetical protein QOJ05_1336, partial [Verrucomicrobiota bacterium]